MIQTFGARSKQQTAYEAANYIAKQSGILKELHQENDVESLSRWENVQELLNAAKEYTEDPDNDAHTLDAFLAEISLFTDQDEQHENPDFVTLMSIHSAKGLEFPSVFVVGMEEDLFPNAMSLQSRADLEEERRLFYVAVTRAKEKLALSFAKSRYRYGSLSFNEPSRFLSEIDQQYLQLPERRRKPASKGQTLGSNLRPMPMRRTRRSTPTSSGKNFEGDDLSGLKSGDMVEHHKFGKGKVLTLEGVGNEKKATVNFQDKGQKVLLLKYAKLKILG